MSDYKPLDGTADVLPVGLQPTPFGEVWQALQQVAASVWDVDPSVYRAGMAWLWYAVNHPDDLASDSLRALLVAVLISEQAPLVKDWQTNAELVEYLRVWRTYSPTYAKLEAIFATFGARVEVRPISDAESQGVVPVTDRRLAFYLRVEEFDAERPLTLDDVYQIAVRATPLGSRPVPYFALVGSSDVFAGPASAGLVRALWASESAEPVTPPTPAYTEITLYMASGTKYTQGGVTSAFTTGVTSTYCYKLYTDEECTIEWDGYDYSNNYVVGGYRISDGEWVEYIDSVAEMPSESSPTKIGYKIGYILMDFSRLWLCTNYNTSGYVGVNVTKIVVRIYPKEQQYYSLYGGASGSVYNNVTISNGGSRYLYGIPNKSSNSLIVPWDGSDASLPTITLQAVLGSAGNLVSGLSLLTDLSSFIIQNFSGASREFRAVVFTLSKPTIISYTNTTNTVVTVNRSTPATLYDDDGNMIPYNANYNYITLGAFSTSGRFYGTFGAAVTDSWAIVQKLKLTANGSGNLQVEFVGSQTLSINKIWYIKTPIS